jgi:hypothetical protein
MTQGGLWGFCKENTYPFLSVEKFWANLKQKKFYL